ncbi:hypothetical protein Hamer_G025876, partial [Homarus americanus]
TKPLSQISDKKKNLPSEKSLKTVKLEPLATDHEEQNNKHRPSANTRERQHPEERRKNSRDTSKNKRNSTSCSSLGAGAQETATNEHTIPNGRGGERLNHERREQLQHQRRGDNDRIAPPPCHLKITQWTVQGLSNKRHTVQAAAIAKNNDVFILQETLMSKHKQFRLPGYQRYSVPKGPNSHGNMILVRATIPSSEVEPVHCGDGVEAQAVRIHLANDSLIVYNINKPPPKRQEAGTCALAWDFNAYHPTINPTTTMNQDGHHLVELLTDLLSPPPHLPPRWNTKRANWIVYQDELQKWYSNYEPAEDIDQLNQDLTDAIQHTAKKTIPKTKTTGSTMTKSEKRITESTHSEDIFDSALPPRE